MEAGGDDGGMEGPSMAEVREPSAGFEERREGEPDISTSTGWCKAIGMLRVGV